MSIQDIWKKINGFDKKQLFWVLSIYGMVFASVGVIGATISQANTKGEVVMSTFEVPKTASVAKQQTNTATVYASKSGKKYYYKNCSGIKRIKSENLVSFATAAAAEGAGLTIAANCKP